MKKTFKTIYTDEEFRRIIREELKAVLSGEDTQVAGGGDEGYIDVTQAAAFLKVKHSTIYNNIHKKTIPFHKSGKRVLFKKSELAAWIKK